MYKALIIIINSLNDYIVIHNIIMSMKLDITTHMSALCMFINPLTAMCNQPRTHKNTHTKVVILHLPPS